MYAGFAFVVWVTSTNRLHALTLRVASSYWLGALFYRFSSMCWAVAHEIRVTPSQRLALSVCGSLYRNGLPLFISGSLFLLGFTLRSKGSHMSNRLTLCFFGSLHIIGYTLFVFGSLLRNGCALVVIGISLLLRLYRSMPLVRYYFPAVRSGNLVHSISAASLLLFGSLHFHGKTLYSIGPLSCRGFASVIWIARSFWLRSDNWGRLLI